MEELSFGEAILSPSLWELSRKLGQKAKQPKRLRCYSPYALVDRTDVLPAAGAAVRRNDGAAGVDGVSLEERTTTPEGEAALLCEIERSLKGKTYYPDVGRGDKWWGAPQARMRGANAGRCPLRPLTQ